MGPAGGFSNQAQFIPNLIFSGVLDRFPRLRWVCAETGIGWVNYMLETCDHEWERRHLWTQGIVTRPSELFKRQINVEFLVRARRHRAAAPDRHGQHHVGIGFSAFDVDLSRVAAVRRAHA